MNLELIAAQVEVIDGEPVPDDASAAKRFASHIMRVAGRAVVAKPMLLLVTAEVALAQAQVNALTTGAGALVRLAADASMLVLVIGTAVSDAGWPSETIVVSGGDAGVALAMALAGDGCDLLAIAALDDAPANIELMVGLIVGAASVRLPVILEGAASQRAASRAIALQPAIAGYVVAVHATQSLPSNVSVLLTVGLGGAVGCGAALSVALVKPADL